MLLPPRRRAVRRLPVFPLEMREMSRARGWPRVRRGHLADPPRARGRASTGRARRPVLQLIPAFRSPSPSWHDALVRNEGVDGQHCPPRERKWTGRRARRVQNAAPPARGRGLACAHATWRTFRCGFPLARANEPLLAVYHSIRPSRRPPSRARAKGWRPAHISLLLSPALPPRARGRVVAESALILEIPV